LRNKKGRRNEKEKKKVNKNGFGQTVNICREGCLVMKGLPWLSIKNQCYFEGTSRQKESKRGHIKREKTTANSRIKKGHCLYVLSL